MPNASTTSGDWLSPAHVKTEFGLGLELLKEHRSRGTGPAHVRAGYRTLRYNRADVAAWMAEHRAVAVPVASAMLDAIRAASERLQGAQAQWHAARVSVAAEVALQYSSLRTCLQQQASI